MSTTTGPVLAAGAITLANTWLLNGRPFDARIPIATGIAAGMLALVERANAPLARTLAWGLVITAIFVPVSGTGHVTPPATSIAKWFGTYQTPKTGK